jgi:hypothetical protein
VAWVEALDSVQAEIEKIRQRAKEGKLIDLDALWLLTGGYK